MKKEKYWPYEHDEDSFFDSESVVSTTECTGLIPDSPGSDNEVESYTDIYDIPQPKDKVNNGLQHE
ncbi:hypothetical protein [Caproiciproducens sp. LBM24188]|nr:hypothetical protein [Oscillospiraceae bacterium]HHV32853.1 hypothetical protein [Clostridiales bacterium]